MKHFFLFIAVSMYFALSYSQNSEKLILIEKSTSSEIISQRNFPVHFAWNNDLIISVNDEELSALSDQGISFTIVDSGAFSGDYYIIASTNTEKDLDISMLDDIIYYNGKVAISRGSPKHRASLFSSGFEVTKLNFSEVRLKSKFKNTTFETGPALDSIINLCLLSINPDSIQGYLQSLENFGTRFCLADNSKELALWLQNKFISMGYTNTVIDSFPISEIWPWGSGGQLYNTWEYNIVATLDGSESPDDIYIVGGHHDNIVYPNGDPLTLAPGADDNGTAIAATLEIARIFSENNIQPKSTIKFIAFGAEELGLLGSDHYASEAFTNGENIQMMINCDMIGTNTEVPGNWHLRLQNYEGSEDITALAKYITGNYTSLISADANNNSSGSDSYSFWAKGYPTIFLQEYEFSPVYHTINDLVVNIDPEYCAEVTKVACGILLHSIESPSHILGLEVSDAGDGTSLYADWQQSKKSDINSYAVFVGISSGVYDTSYITSDTNFLIQNLTEGTEYYIGVSAIDTDANQGLISEAKGTPLSVPRTPVELEQLVSYPGIFIGWKKNQERDILGYNVYRSSSEFGTYTLMNSIPIGDTTFTDNTVVDYTYYYYKVSATDSTLNESELSSSIKSCTITHDQGILIVDDSEGGWMNPSDQQVDDFYSNLLINFTHSNYDAFDSTKIVLADMGMYSTLLWHINRKVNKPVFYKNQKEVKKFLESGGNLLFTVYEPQGAAMNINAYPYLYKPGDFIYDYLKIAYSDEVDEAMFIGATPFMTGYDSLFIDTLKTPPNNNYHVSGIESIDPNVEGSTVYRYDSYFSSSVPAGSMTGKSIGVEYLGSDYKAITLSFPLYFMKYNESKSFIDYVMEQKFGEILGVNEPQNNENVFSFSIYPNPVNDFLSLEVFSDRPTIASLEIYAITGQLLNTISIDCAKGIQVKIIDLSSVPVGFYLCRLKTGCFVSTRKLQVLR